MLMARVLSPPLPLLPALHRLKWKFNLLDHQILALFEIVKVHCQDSHDSDVLETFAKLRNDGNLSDEEALLKFIATYDDSLSTLNQICCKPLFYIKLFVLLHCGINSCTPACVISKAKYKEMTAYVWLDSSVEGANILPLETFRLRIPLDVFRRICTDADKAMLQYGIISMP
jgi:hypothetical protein